MEIIRIKDAQDTRVDIFSRFNDAELKRGFTSKGPIAQGSLFIAESQNVIERALASGITPAAIFTDEKWLCRAEELLKSLSSKNPELPVYLASQDMFKQVTGYSQVRGILAAMHRPAPKSTQELIATSSRIAILENIGNYTNIGAIFRSAAALNIDAVLLSPSCHDPFYRRAARVSMGTVFQVPWAFFDESSPWPQDALKLLERHGFTTIALALCDESLSIDDPRLKTYDKLAMVLGTEGDGLAPSTIAECHHTVRIPMAHEVDSLNVAAASAVAFWELRKR